MGCNGFNHTDNCRCGWRGGWKGRFSSESNSNGMFVLNVKCPVCSENVYYYQNTQGSKVFFDQLGHPWPKHPCTVSKEQESKIVTSNVKQVALSAFDISKSNLYKNKYSIKYYKGKVSLLFFFTAEDLSKVVDVKCYSQGKSLTLRIYLYLEKYKQYCILEGNAYKEHPNPKDLRKLKLIKLGDNIASYTPTLSVGSKVAGSDLTRCNICNAKVNKKNLRKHMMKCMTK